MGGTSWKISYNLIRDVQERHHVNTLDWGFSTKNRRDDDLNNVLRFTSSMLFQTLLSIVQERTHPRNAHDGNTPLSNESIHHANSCTGRDIVQECLQIMKSNRHVLPTEHVLMNLDSVLLFFYPRQFQKVRHNSVNYFQWYHFWRENQRMSIEKIYTWHHIN